MLQHTKKTLLIPLMLFIFSGIFFIKDTSLAQVIDQKCFTKAQCDDARKAIGGGEGDGFYTGKQETIKACGGKSATGEELGFCLPAGKTTTNIAFGGKKEFANLGEFIQYMYRYGIIFAGILAVIMIIIAGLQWTASGGNSSTIESAKKRIAGAITGLILASTSYIILNTLNPNMVNLRLPQVWLINSMGLAPSMCREVDDGTALLLASASNESKLTEAQKVEKIKQGGATFVKQKNSNIPCGNAYFVAGSGTMTCDGDTCNPGKVCAPQFFTNPSIEDKSKLDCLPGVIAGKVYHSNFKENMDNSIERFFGEGWKWNDDPMNTAGWIIGTPAFPKVIKLEAVCKNGDRTDRGFVHAQSTRKSLQPKEIYYILKVENIASVIAQSKSDCTNKGGLRGFVLEVQMSESTDVYENHYIGKMGTLGVDLGDDGAKDKTLASDASTQYLITEEDLTQGIILNIDAAQVHDIDGFFSAGDNMRSKYYTQYGFGSTQQRAAADAQHEENRPVPD